MLCITIINTILAVGSFGFSVYVFVKNKLYSKTNVEIAVLNAISQAISAAAEHCDNLAVFKDDTSALGDSIRQNATSAFDGILLAYDYACAKYYEQSIRPEYFKTTYTSRIRELFLSPTYTQLLETKGNYPYLHRFYLEHCVKHKS